LAALAAIAGLLLIRSRRRRNGGSSSLNAPLMKPPPPLPRNPMRNGGASASAPPHKHMRGGGVGECSVCLDGERNTMFQPCGHLSTCGTCAARLDRCPVCRAKITAKLRVYT
jgi:hypothetical protein